MPRTARSIVSQEIYHVLNRGNGRTTIFHQDADYVQFLHLLRRAKSDWPISLFGYCLMPNHFHLILRPDNSDAVGCFMHWLLTTHVRRHHQHLRTSGRVWQGRYKSFQIEGDAHLLMVMRYVERNPVRAGLATSAKRWRWSSHREHLGLAISSLVDPAPIELPRGWAEYVDQPLREGDLDRIRRSIRRQYPY